MNGCTNRSWRRLLLMRESQAHAQDNRLLSEPARSGELTTRSPVRQTIADRHGRARRVPAATTLRQPVSRRAAQRTIAGDLRVADRPRSSRIRLATATAMHDAAVELARPGVAPGGPGSGRLAVVQAAVSGDGLAGDERVCRAHDRNETTRIANPGRAWRDRRRLRLRGR
jgi:hypothetical protein